MTRREMENRQLSAEHLLAEQDFGRAVLESLEEGVVACDAGGVLTLFNGAARQMHGLTVDLLLVDDWAQHFDLLPPDQTGPLAVDDVPLFRALSGDIVRDVEMMIVPKNGRTRLVRANGRAIARADGRKLGAVVTLHDITGRRAAEQELSHQASTDVLTGLGNRASLTVHVEQSLRRAASAGSAAAVLVIDLDDFKKVNDSLGHAAGDLLLVEMASRLRTCLRDGDAAVRLGADQFAVALDDTSEEEAVVVAYQILAATRAPLALGDGEVTVTASIGIASSEGRSDGAASLLRAADLAMYVAKSGGKDAYAVFEPDMQVAASGRLAIQADLRRAHAQGDLRVVYQPVISLTNGAIVGVEALLRWDLPDRSSVRPDDFIPVAEDSGLIVPIGAWVLEEACAQARRWDAIADRTPLIVAVNISARQLRRRGLITTVMEILGRTGLEPGRLVLELTESTLMDDDEPALTTLREIERLGVRLSIDDFGTGYSSLSRLRTLPIATLKIDRSFVHDIRGPNATAPLVAATLAMARGLGLSVVAEGIETIDQLEFLCRLGCPQAQGFLMSEPVDALTIGRMIERNAPLVDIHWTPAASDAPAGSELTDAVEAVVRTSAGDEEAIRPLLTEMARITGLDSTYLTEIHPARSVHEIRYARNSGELDIREGRLIDWTDSLCRAGMLGRPSNTDQVQVDHPESAAARELGLQTYVSVPVLGPDGRTFGTLCGASPKRRKLSDTEMAVVDLFARLIADRI